MKNKKGPEKIPALPHKKNPAFCTRLRTNHALPVEMGMKRSRRMGLCLPCPFFMTAQTSLFFAFMLVYFRLSVLFDT
jgi:hypothetical protein